MSKVREETYKEEELRRTLEEINRDARGGYRDKKARDSKSGGGEKTRDRRGGEEERRRHRDGGEEKKRAREEKEDRRHQREDGDERRRHRDEKDDRRRQKESGDDKRRHREEKEDSRRQKDEKDERRRHKEDGDDRRRHRDEKEESRRHKDEKDERRRHKEDGDDRRRHREEKEEPRRHKDEKEERKRHKEGADDRRRHRDEKEDSRRPKEGGDDRRRHVETEEEREKRKKEERRKRREEEGEGDERRRHRDDRKRKEREETEEERDRRKREERRKRKEEEEKRRKEEEAAEEERRRRQEEEKKREAVKEEKEDDYDDYEDDFEAYDDDFENEDDASSGAVNEKNKEMADILRAMSAENDRLVGANDGRDSSSSSTSGEVIPNRRKDSGGPKYFINFVSARTRQVDAAVSNRTRQRSRELLRLIHLDSTSYDMFEMGQLEEYQLYMRSFGREAANQVACQTNDDAMEREAQCEPIERRTLWTQHPPDDLNAVGLADPIAARGDSGNRRRSSLGRYGSLQEQMAEEEAIRSREMDSRQVLSSASLLQSMTIVLRLLEEEARPQVSAPPDSECRHLSNGYSSFACPPELCYLPCCFMTFSPTQSNLLITIHSYGVSGRAGPGERDVAFGLVWNVTSPREPQDILEAPTRALCGRFSPLTASLVFMGLVDGSLALWDLREPISWHPTDAKGRRRRAATYSTALVHLEDNHQAPVVDLCCVASPVRPNAVASSFQLASLDAHGVVLLWVTTQLPTADQAGSEADYGLRPGGRIRLSRTVRLQPTPLFLGGRAVGGGLGDFQSPDCPQQFTLTAALAPSIESGAFLVGSELGGVHHIGRIGGRLHPRLFEATFTGSSPSSSPVVSLDLSPFQEPYFLAGYRDGEVRLFHCRHEQPLITFADFGATAGLVQVAWSCSRPAVFFALDGAGCLFTFDLTMQERGPMRQEKPGQAAGGRRLLRVALSSDYSATRRGDRGRRPQIAFSFSAADFLEVHELAEDLSIGDLDEAYRMANLLSSLV